MCKQVEKKKVGRKLGECYCCCLSRWLKEEEYGFSIATLTRVGGMISFSLSLLAIFIALAFLVTKCVRRVTYDKLDKLSALWLGVFTYL